MMLVSILWFSGMPDTAMASKTFWNHPYLRRYPKSINIKKSLSWRITL